MARPDLSNYDIDRVEFKACNRCGELSEHAVYNGHTFCEGSVLWYCLPCGKRTIESRERIE